MPASPYTLAFLALPKNVALKESPGPLRTLPPSLGKQLRVPSAWASMLAYQSWFLWLSGGWGCHNPGHNHLSCPDWPKTPISYLTTSY